MKERATVANTHLPADAIVGFGLVILIVNPSKRLHENRTVKSRGSLDLQCYARGNKVSRVEVS